MVVNPIDRFADSFNATVDELVWIGKTDKWIYQETYDFWSLWYYFLNGFKDRGDSWELAYAILRHNGIDEWFSP